MPEIDYISTLANPYWCGDLHPMRRLLSVKNEINPYQDVETYICIK